VSPDGTKVFVTGYSVGSSTGADYATGAYRASTRHLLWARRYNGPLGNRDDYALGLSVSPRGTKLFVTGESPGTRS
jgi:hypothetical protein